MWVWVIEWEFTGTSTHHLDGYISANQRFFSTFLSNITKYNRVSLGFDPSVARLLGNDPTPRQTCPVVWVIERLLVEHHF